MGFVVHSFFIVPLSRMEHICLPSYHRRFTAWPLTLCQHPVVTFTWDRSWISVFANVMHSFGEATEIGQCPSPMNIILKSSARTAQVSLTAWNPFINTVQSPLSTSVGELIDYLTNAHAVSKIPDLNAVYEIIVHLCDLSTMKIMHHPCFCKWDPNQQQWHPDNSHMSGLFFAMWIIFFGVPLD